MSSIGPDLPPHLLAKRKRQEDERAQDEGTTLSGATADHNVETPEKRRRIMGPVRPNNESQTAQSTQAGKQERNSRASVDDSTAPRKVVGPAPPPAPLEERPTEDTESSEDDDNLGPALPTGNDDGNSNNEDNEDMNAPTTTSSEAEPQRLRRDDWMTMAPQQDDLAARMDPTKIRARGFNTGRAARGDTGSGSNAAWHETAEQKQKRLANEVLGIAATPPQTLTKTHRADKEKAERDEQTARKLRETAEKARGPSLLDKHKQVKPDDVEDDPSKRAFNWEKDMGNASRISGSQKREMISKAGAYSSRFSGGSYL